MSYQKENFVQVIKWFEQDEKNKILNNKNMNDALILVSSIHITISMWEFLALYVY